MTSKTKYKVLHFISQGTIGGMEKAIYQLLKTFKDDNDFEFGVVMGTDKGLYAGKIKDLRVPVICLESNSGFRINTDRSVLNKLQNY